jgi:hypothetical protein
MAETLGSLCDKLTIVKLKQWHSEDKERIESLGKQEAQLQQEINKLILDAVHGEIEPERLTFAANKVYKKEGNIVNDVEGDIGEMFAELAKVNCELWHEQEKVYEFEKVAVEEKDGVIKQLAILNLSRNKCIDQIDKTFQQLILKRK